MPKGRPVEEITLSENERCKLELMASRPKSSQRDAQRAGIILACADGLANQAVAERMGVCVQTVGKWRSRFAAGRIEALTDAPRPGAPRTISDAKVEEVVTETLEQKPKARTHWSSRLMAEKSGISDHSVRRIWKAFGLKPHQVKGFKLSKDPMFVEKVRDIVGLYLNPPEKAIVLCVDEKSQCQALERTQPILPMRPGIPERQSHDYERHGTLSLFAAYDIATGYVLGKSHARHRSQEFLMFLKEIDTAWPDDGNELHIIMDNYATHKTDKVQRWLDRHQRFQIHFTPTGASWINLVERFFGKITNQAIRRGSFSSVNQLRKAMDEYINMHNENPKPFQWTATPDSIFEKMNHS
ncbi:IS630 family transposase, partial [Cerasicoccus maritimus]|uniref:IS630 family transposase n=1 Tax=Cerasicoccus maritimus TaxID=490089 RepID=UPI00285272F1